MCALINPAPRLAKALFRGSVALLAIGGLWLGSLAVGHLVDSSRAAEIRLVASRIRIEQLEARRAEKDFLMRSLADSSFFREGKSPYQERHATAVEALRRQIQALIALCTPGEVPEIERILGQVTAYAASFQALMEACRRSGFPGWGTEGAWSEALARLDGEAERTPSPEIQRAVLKLKEGHWRYLRTMAADARQRISEDLGALRDWIPRAPSGAGQALGAAMALYEERLEEYERLRDLVGRSEDRGLLGEMRSAIRTVDPAIDGVLNRANAVLLARHHRRTVTLLAASGAMTVFLALALISARSARSRAGKLLVDNLRLEREIQDRTRAVKVLEERQERLLQAERLAAIGQMVAGLAHESRNALQRGQACLEMLARRVAGVPRAPELVARIQSAQDDLQRLYEEVREYAAPVHLRREEHRLDAILERSWEKLGLRRAGREALLLQDGRDLDLRCQVDAFAVERVFRNLLENSLEACRDPVEISVEWSDADAGGRPAVRATLRDNGPGIQPPAREKIFQPFHTTKMKGTGLGLTIARRLVELHEGSIEARAGKGMEVVIAIPRKGQPA